MKVPDRKPYLSCSTTVGMGMITEEEWQQAENYSTDQARRMLPNHLRGYLQWEDVRNAGMTRLAKEMEVFQKEERSWENWFPRVIDLGMESYVKGMPDQSELKEAVRYAERLAGRLFHRTFSKHLKRLWSPGDLQQGALERFCRDLRRYDRARLPWKFWYKKTILRGMLSYRREVRPGSQEMQDIINEANAAWKELAQCLGRRPTNEEWAEALGVSITKLDEIRRWDRLAGTPVPVNHTGKATKEGEDEGNTEGYEPSGPGSVTQEERILIEQLMACIGKLKPDVQGVLWCLYFQDYTIKQTRIVMTRIMGEEFTKAMVVGRHASGKNDLRRELERFWDPDDIERVLTLKGEGFSGRCEARDPELIA